MLAHRLQATIGHDKTLILENLPFHSGEQVEIIILSQPNNASDQNKYPLRGTAVQYVEPTQPVAQADWDVTE
jgi:hypothetical protein